MGNYCVPSFGSRRDIPIPESRNANVNVPDEPYEENFENVVQDWDAKLRAEKRYGEIIFDEQTIRIIGEYVGELCDWIIHAKGLSNHPNERVTISDDGLSLEVGRKIRGRLDFKSWTPHRFITCIGPNTQQCLSLTKGKLYHVMLALELPGHTGRRFDSNRIFFGIVSKNCDRIDEIPGSKSGFGWRGSGLLTQNIHIDIPDARLPPFGGLISVLGLEIDCARKLIRGFVKRTVKAFHFRELPEQFYFAFGAYHCSFDEKLIARLIQGGTGPMPVQEFRNLSRVYESRVYELLHRTIM